MQTKINTEIWIKDNDGILQYKGQKKAEDVFKELKNYLECNNLIPDEYFLFNNYGFEENELFPRCYRLMCYCVYGGSEGIYLDMDLNVNFDGKKNTIIHFATGKTLRENNIAMDQMYKIACEITKIFDR